MIKTFISHATTEDDFSNWLNVQLKRDFPKLEIFVDHDALTEGTLKVGGDAKEIMRKIEESIFFIAVLSDEYCKRGNCMAELERALSSRNKTTQKLPVVFPLVSCSQGLIPAKIKIKLDLDSPEGVMGDFSDGKKWGNSYENLRKAIQYSIDELKLLSEDADFYRNCEHLDITLRRDKPTSAEVKIVIDVLKGEEYQQYFFKRLNKLSWLSYLRNYGFFNRNPKPIESADQPGCYIVPYWPVLDYLEKVSQECSKPENKEYAEDLIQIIRNVTKYRDENGQKIDNFRTWGTFTKILVNLPPQVIKLEDVALIEEWLDSRFNTLLVGAEVGKRLIPKFLESTESEDWEKVSKILEIATRLKWPTREYVRSPDTNIGSYWLRELFTKNVPLLGTKCGIQTINTLVERIKEILIKENNDEHSFIWRRAIEDHEQNIGDYTARDVLITVLRNVLIAFLESGHTEKDNVLGRLLSSELKIVKRIVIFAIGKKWAEYKHLFWSFFSSECLDENNFRHEIFILIKENFRNLDEEEKRQIIDCVEEGPKWLPDERKERYIAKWKLRWFAAMHSHGDPKVEALYEKYKATAELEPKYPEFESYTESYSGTVSPIGIEELLKMSTTEIISYLDEYKGPERWPGQPSEEGLGDILKEAVRREPHKFTSELDQFLGIKFLHKHRIISAFKELWQEKRVIDWGKILGFCLAIVSNPEFWKDETTYEDTEIKYRDWVTGAVADLIESGTRDDAWAFDKEHFPITESVLLKILEHQESQMKEINDASGYAINTSKGRVLIALITFALRVARVEKKEGIEKEAKWNEAIRKEFDKRLDKMLDPSLEFSTLVGNYLPNLYYLDKQWVLTNINRIFPKEYPDHWNVSMQGYLFGHEVYEYLYNLLREYSHYEKALATFKEDTIRRQLLHHICVMYLKGKEKLLFEKVLMEWEQTDISEIISFFWMHREVELEESWKKRIFDFWRDCYTKLKGKDDRDFNTADRKILSDLNLLVSFLESISAEIKDWLILSTPYVDVNYHSSILIECLDNLAEKNPVEVGEVYLNMLNRTAPSYPEERIISLVEKLYSKGQKHLANKICDMYGRAGHYFLQDLYRRNNS